MPSQTFPDRVPRRLDLLWRRGGLLLAGGATAVMLISCGGSSQPAITREATTTPAQPMAPARERSIDNKRRGPNAPNLPTRPRLTSVSHGDSQSGCPSALNHAQCVAAGRAFERARSGGSRIVKPGECPSAMSRAQCVAAGRAFERARSGGSRIVKPGECPSAMSRAQCVAAGKAFERARSGSG